MKLGDYYTAQELSRTLIIPLYDYGKFDKFVGRKCTVKRRSHTLTNSFILTADNLMTRDLKENDVILCINMDKDPEYFL